MREDLTPVQKEMIAGLTESPAFNLLLDVLQQDVRVLEDQMQTAQEQERALWIMHQWRSLRYILRALKTQPAQFSADLKEILEARQYSLEGYLPRIDTPSSYRFPFEA